MQQPAILYCIEHVARELDIACIIRHTLRERYGLDALIQPFAGDLAAALAPVRPQLIVVPFCRTRRDYGLEVVVRRFPQVPIINLAFEQLLSRGNRQHRVPSDVLSRNCVTHIASGSFFRQWLETAGVPREHIVTTGSMTCQLYREPYAWMYESCRDRLAQQYGLDAERPWIFFPENFAAAFFSKSQIRFRRRRGYNPQSLAEYVDHTRRSFDELAGWCADAAAANNIELIIRPRPAVSQTVFEQAFLRAAGCVQPKHLHFIKAGDVREWIFASQAVVSSYSSTIVEAAIAGKPVHLLLPVPIPRAAGAQWLEIAPTIRGRDEFLSVTSSPAANPPDSALRDWAEANLLAHGDALGNVARLLAESCHGERMLPSPAAPPIWRAGIDTVREALKRSERVVRRRLPGRRPRIIGHECDLATRHDIESRCADWQRCLATRGAA